MKNITIVGSGMTGSTVARVLADAGFAVRVLEKRDVVSGNMSDPVLSSGHRIHAYGPHAFHTNSDKVFNFLSRFTKWREYKHEVVANIFGEIIPVPFNFNAIKVVFPEDSKSIIRNLKERYDDNEHVPVLKMLESENPIERLVAEFAYKNVFEFYTQKQWGLSPKEIDASITARVPIRMGYNNQYFLDKHQCLPDPGYKEMICNMLDHENIDVQMNSDFLDLEKDFTVFTGSLDRLFDYRFGVLPYRSLRFDFETHANCPYLPAPQMNFTVDKEWTRLTDYSRMCDQRLETTIVGKEFSEEFEPGKNDPFYPMPIDSAKALYNEYKEYAEAHFPNLILAGRLADYRYYNMDQACARGLSVAKNILEGKHE